MTSVIEEIQTNWRQISPADLCDQTRADFFVFVANHSVLHIELLERDCLFTSIICASSSRSQSLYGLDIWIGDTTADLDLLEEDQKEDLKQIIQWSIESELGIPQRAERLLRIVG